MSRNAIRFKLFLSFAVAVPYLVSCSGGSTQSAKPAIAVSVTPPSASVAVGMTAQFNANVTGTMNTQVTWAVAGGSLDGTISATGLYTAPANVPNPAAVTVTATSQADTSKSASASVTVTKTASAVSVSVSPASASVANFSTQQFSAMVTGSSNTAVTWQVNGTTGGNQQVGFISANGLFVAPAGVPTKSDGQGGSVTTTVTVTAVSQASPSSTGSATVTLAPAGQNAQSGAIKLGASGSNVQDSSVSGRTITCCGGTLGALVTRGGTQFVLSNNHVLARSDIAQTGDAISNPGLVDNNCNAATTVANLTQFYNFETGALPHIDAAIAQVVSGHVDTGGNILYLGASADGNGVPLPGAPHAGNGIAASVSEKVAKSGRSTGLTCSTVLATSVATSVEYQKGCGTGTKFSVSFTGQIDVAGGGFSAEGDSGSLIVDQNTADPVALLFAGSDTDSVGNPVSQVLSFFSSGANPATFVGGAAHQVIGCALPARPQSAISQAEAQATSERVAQALTVRNAHAAELLAHPEVQALGVGLSYDNPSEPAVVFFVTEGQPRTGIPLTIDGVRTRVVEGRLFSKRGSVTEAETQEMEQSSEPRQLVYAISQVEQSRAQAVHTAHVSEWVGKSGVQGFGIGSSVDAPGEAAMVIFTIRGQPHDPIAPTIDGVRTRIREGSRFRAGFSDQPAPSACKVPAPPKKPR
jgi:hypothetical protein